SYMSPLSGGATRAEMRSAGAGRGRIDVVLRLGHAWLRVLGHRGSLATARIGGRFQKVEGERAKLNEMVVERQSRAEIGHARGDTCPRIGRFKQEQSADCMARA